MKLSADRVRELESEISRIKNVGFCSILLGEDRRPTSIDIVADLHRAPRRIVRDVEIVLRKHGLSVDHRMIGVVQMENPQERLASSVVPFPPARASAAPDDALPAILQLVPDSERLRLAAVHSTMRDGLFSVEVELSMGAFEGVPGRAEGPGRDSDACAALVARATLEAVRNLLQPQYEAELREARVLYMGGGPLVAVVVDFGSGRHTQRLAGACPQSGSLYDTVVYATLDALNRPLGRAHFREVATLVSAPAEGEGPIRAVSA